MRVGWLQTYDAIKGGAEITADLCKQAKPADVEIVECPAGAVVPGLDAYVVSNCTGYTMDDFTIDTVGPTPIVRFVQDAWPHGDDAVRRWLLDSSTRLLFLSPLHVDTFAWDVDRDRVELVPPPIDGDSFHDEDTVEVTGFGSKQRHYIRTGQPVQRHGTVWLGQWTWAGKGIEAAAQWGSENGGITFYGEGPLVPPKLPGVEIKPAIPYEHVAALLARSERLVHLPTKPEPFARTVAEAWLAGCEVVTNENAGAVWWLRERPDDVARGAELFWKAVAECA